MRPTRSAGRAVVGVIADEDLTSRRRLYEVSEADRVGRKVVAPLEHLTRDGRPRNEGLVHEDLDALFDRLVGEEPPRAAKSKRSQEELLQSPRPLVGADVRFLTASKPSELADSGAGKSAKGAVHAATQAARNSVEAEELAVSDTLYPKKPVQSFIDREKRLIPRPSSVPSSERAWVAPSEQPSKRSPQSRTAQRIPMP